MTRYIHRGITLVELIIVIAIVAILLAVAVPNFSNQITSNQIAGNMSDFADTLRRAKTESGARLATVTVCIRAAGNVCNPNGSWHDGWFVLLPDGTILYEYEAFNQQIAFTATDANNNAITAIDFTPSGTTSLNGPATFVMSSRDTIIRGILVTVTGHSSPLNCDIETGVCQ